MKFIKINFLFVLIISLNTYGLGHSDKGNQQKTQREKSTQSDVPSIRVQALPLFPEGKNSVLFDIVDNKGKTPTMKVFYKTVTFKTVELKKDPNDPTQVIVILKGNNSTREFPKKVSLKELTQGKRINVSVSGIKENVAGRDVIGSASMDFQYDSATGNIILKKVSGRVDVPLAGTTIGDEGSLSDLTGNRQSG